MRKHHLTATATMMILKNMGKDKEKLKRKNIPKRNKMDINQIKIVKETKMTQQIKISITIKASLSGMVLQLTTMKTCDK